MTDDLLQENACDLESQGLVRRIFHFKQFVTTSLYEAIHRVSGVGGLALSVVGRIQLITAASDSSSIAR
jgi:hypothetical protein